MPTPALSLMLDDFTEKNLRRQNDGSKDELNLVILAQEYADEDKARALLESML